MWRACLGLLVVVGCSFDPKAEPPGELPVVSFGADGSQTDEGVGTEMVVLKLSKPALEPVTVKVSVVGGDATGDDYMLASAEVRFDVGQSASFAPVTIVDDGVSEGEEKALLELANPVGATIGEFPRHELRIAPGLLPRLNFQPGTMTYDEPIATQSFPVTLDSLSTTEVVYAFSVTGSATLGDDHMLMSGMRTIPPNTMTDSIAATIVNDLLDEYDETIELSLTALSGAVIGVNRGRMHTIRDEDAPPTIGFSNVTTTPETGTATVTVTLSAVSGKEIKADYSAAPGSASQADFTPTTGTLTFPAGTTTQTFTVTVSTDALDEDDETIALSLGNLVEVGAGQTTQNLTILDDDATPTLSFETALSNGDEDNGTATVRIVLSAISGRDVTFSINTSGIATQPADYSIPNGPYTIPAGQRTFDLVVTLVKDGGPPEGPETAIFTLANLTNADPADPATHTLTIVD